MGGAMSYQALYRQWRPQTFGDLVGQEQITAVLQNALEQGKLAHAYLLCGPRGTGKTSAAKILAKAVNCEKGPSREPCNRCAACQGIQEGRVMDVLEIDAASNRGIEEIRDLRDKARYAPVEVRRKVYIIDEVHMLTQEAFNALLKTLEEPPGPVLFVLATTEPHRLPATIVSRCQRLDFRLIGLPDIVERLRLVVQANQRDCSEQALYLIAEEAAGGLRDALSQLEQVLAFTQGAVDEQTVLAVLGAVGRDVFYSLTSAVVSRNLTSALLLLQDVVADGKDLHHFTQQAIGYYRDLMVALACGGEARLLGIAPEWAERLRNQAGSLGLGTIGRILSVLHALLGEIRWSARPRLLWELALFRIFGLEEQEQNVYVAEIAPPPPVQAEAARVNEPAVHKKAAPEAVPQNDFHRHWPRILQEVKKESVRVHALLLSAQAAMAGNILELGFSSSFHCEMMEGNRTVLEKVVKKLYGESTVIRCLAAGQSEVAAAAERDPDELVSSAAELFCGKIIEDGKSM